MANKGMTEFRADGEDYILNDPNIADEFSTSAAYNIGDRVYHEGKLYRFTSYHAAGAWNSSHVTQTKVTTYEQSLEQLIQINEDYYAIQNITDSFVKTGVTSYDPSTCAISLVNYFANFKYPTQYHRYRVITDKKMVRIGERETDSSGWARAIDLQEESVFANGYYYYDYLTQNNNYVLTCESDPNNMITKLAIYDISFVPGEATEGLTKPQAVYYWAENICGLDFEDMAILARIRNSYYASNVVTKKNPANFEYHVNDGTFTTENPLLNMTQSWEPGHTYRFICNARPNLIGERLNDSSTWAIGVPGSSFIKSADDYFYYDYTFTNDGYIFTVDRGSSMTRFAIYDVSNMCDDAKNALTRIYLPYYLGFRSEEAGSTGKKRNIIAVGDSQTQRTGYVEQLRTMITDGRSVSKYGQGGIDSVNMVAVQGGISLDVEPFTIPAGTTAVQITLKNGWGGDVGALGLQSTAGINPVTIDGIEGNISVTYDAGYTNVKYYFTRSASGSQKVVSRPAKVQTNLSKTGTDNILVLWLGTNDSATISDPDELCERMIYALDSAIQYNEAPQYIVMSLTSKAYMTRVAEANQILAKKYGVHYLDLRSYLIEYGLSDASITPTIQDQTDIANGEIPSSLRADSVHLNTAGYTVVGQLLYRKGVELGYWR